jgi:RNA polymerase sigma factor FliA
MAETTSQPPAETAAPSGVLVEDEAFWTHLRANPQDLQTRDALVERFLPLVKSEAERLGSHLPSHVDRQELYAEGAVGLLRAVSNFDPTQGVSFQIYARKRIWGAMMDRVRSMDCVPRSVRKAARKITRAIARFQHDQGRQPSEDELAGLLSCSVAELHELERQAALGQFLSLDVGPQDETDSAYGLMRDRLHEPDVEEPLEKMVSAELRADLVKGLKTLPDRERAVLVLYYVEGVRLKEIAEAMQVSESRVSQLHSQALLRLRGFLECPGRREAARHADEVETDEVPGAVHGLDGAG